MLWVVGSWDPVSLYLKESIQVPTFAVQVDSSVDESIQK